LHLADRLPGAARAFPEIEVEDGLELPIGQRGEKARDLDGMIQVQQYEETRATLAQCEHAAHGDPIPIVGSC
jgi:hypothetical protein